MVSEASSVFYNDLIEGTKKILKKKIILLKLQYRFNQHLCAYTEQLWKGMVTGTWV